MLAWIADAMLGVWTAAGSTGATVTPTPTPSPAGVGGAIGTVAGAVVIALIAGAFLWMRARALRR
ncbi:MAG: hypothetical protein ACXWXQ_09315 [Actinomycetota bacterium]